jgi:hypothetical protein
MRVKISIQRRLKKCLEIREVILTSDFYCKILQITSMFNCLIIIEIFWIRLDFGTDLRNSDLSPVLTDSDSIPDDLVCFGFIRIYYIRFIRFIRIYYIRFIRFIRI